MAITHDTPFINDIVIQKIQFVNSKIEKEAGFDNGVHLNNESLTESHPASTYIIADFCRFVKQFGKDFAPLLEVSKAVLNPDGTPKVFLTQRWYMKPFYWLLLHK